MLLMCFQVMGVDSTAERAASEQWARWLLLLLGGGWAHLSRASGRWWWWCERYASFVTLGTANAQQRWPLLPQLKV